MATSLLLQTKSLSLTLENTHLLRKGKYPCMDDLLIYRCRFNQTSKASESKLANRRLAVTLYFSLCSTVGTLCSLGLLQRRYYSVNYPFAL